MFLHITNARHLNNYKIEVSFNDGRNGQADLSTVVAKGIFQKLKDQQLFAQVKVDPQTNTITWPGGLDLAPEYVYFLTFKGEPGLQDKFVKWGYA